MRQTFSIELEKENVPRYKESLYACTIIRLHLRVNDLSSGQFSIYGCENAT